MARNNNLLQMVLVVMTIQEPDGRQLVRLGGIQLPIVRSEIANFIFYLLPWSTDLWIWEEPICPWSDGTMVRSEIECVSGVVSLGCHNFKELAER